MFGFIGDAFRAVKSVVGVVTGTASPETASGVSSALSQVSAIAKQVADTAAAQAAAKTAAAAEAQRQAAAAQAAAQAEAARQAVASVGSSFPLPLLLGGGALALYLVTRKR